MADEQEEVVQGSRTGTEQAKALDKVTDQVDVLYLSGYWVPVDARMREAARQSNLTWLRSRRRRALLPQLPAGRAARMHAGRGEGGQERGLVRGASLHDQAGTAAAGRARSCTAAVGAGLVSGGRPSLCLPAGVQGSSGHEIPCLRAATECTWMWAGHAG